VLRRHECPTSPESGHIPENDDLASAMIAVRRALPSHLASAPRRRTQVARHSEQIRDIRHTARAHHRPAPSRFGTPRSRTSHSRPPIAQSHVEFPPALILADKRKRPSSGARREGPQYGLEQVERATTVLFSVACGGTVTPRRITPLSAAFGTTLR
jgi:hypothetical protein